VSAEPKVSVVQQCIAALLFVRVQHNVRVAREEFAVLLYAIMAKILSKIGNVDWCYFSLSIASPFGQEITLNFSMRQIFKPLFTYCFVNKQV
jgi:hypothetical protein